MRKPGCRPADFPPLTFQPSSEIASNRSGPRTSSLVVSGRRPIRLANQLESGTSSIVFTLRARTSCRCPRSANVFATKSYPFESSIGTTFDASSDMSSSAAMGSSG